VSSKSKQINLEYFISTNIYQIFKIKNKVDYFLYISKNIKMMKLDIKKKNIKTKNIKIMELDIKTIIIFILLATSLFFGLKWFWGGNKDLKNEANRLEQEFKELEKRKKETDLEIESWKEKFNSLKSVESKLKQENEKLEQQTKKAEQDANLSKANLDKLKGEIKETQEKIEEFKKNPPNRTGDALLESIKNKTKTL
jgi:DNA repair exonuclease SbcCD ATPase subunit